MDLADHDTSSSTVSPSPPSLTIATSASTALNPISPRRQFQIELSDSTSASRFNASISRTANPSTTAKRVIKRVEQQPIKSATILQGTPSTLNGTKTITFADASNIPSLVSLSSSSPTSKSSSPPSYIDPNDPSRSVRSSSPALLDPSTNRTSHSSSPHPPLPPPPQPQPRPIIRSRPVPNLPPAELASLVRSHIRHVDLSARLKTKTNIRELRQQYTDRRQREISQLSPTRIRLSKKKKTTHSTIGSPSISSPSASTTISSPRLASTRSPRRSIIDQRSANILDPAHLHPSSTQSLPPPPAGEVIPWPSWKDTPAVPSYAPYLADPQLFTSDQTIWRDQLGHPLGIESGPGSTSTTSYDSTNSNTGLSHLPLIHSHHNSLRMPPIKPIKSGKNGTKAMRSKGLNGSFVPIQQVNE